MGEGRVAVVTGASRGIGAAVACRLAADGCRVAGISRTVPAAPDPGVLHLGADVTDQAALRRAFADVTDTLGPPSIVVANAGVLRAGLAVATSETILDELLDLNVRAAFLTVQLGLRGMLRARWGRVVLVSSVSAFTGVPGQVAYSASKAALIGMAGSLAREVGRRGVTVNVVAPGPIETELLAETGIARERLLEAVPAGRVGSPAEVAAAVSFLCSEEAAYVSGAVLPVDGAMSA